jgi:acyl dehydratase
VINLQAAPPPLAIGDIFRAPSRTLTDPYATAFQAVSADNHPIHYNVGEAVIIGRVFE